jgi:hypothetical protein
MRQKTVVIIKGNPRYIANNERADRFYEDLHSFFSDLNYQVFFDAGEPYTIPSKADLWVGHSRGADRLRFAPKGTVIVGIGVPPTEDSVDFPIINHPDDEMAAHACKEEVINDTHHYTLTEEMKEKLRKIVLQMRKSATIGGRRA